MESDDRIRGLVATGTSNTANCQSCLGSHVEKAIGHGARPEEAVAAIEVGSLVGNDDGAKREKVSSRLKGRTAPIAMGVVMEGNGYQFLGP